jgi:hypothetical protein
MTNLDFGYQKQMNERCHNENVFEFRESCVSIRSPETNSISQCPLIDMLLAISPASKLHLAITR